MRKFLGRQSTADMLRDNTSYPLSVSIEFDASSCPEGQSWNITFSDSHVFHVSLRTKSSTIVLNELVNEKYKDETRIPFLYFRRIQLRLLFLRDKVKVLINGCEALERKLAFDLGTSPSGSFDWDFDDDVTDSGEDLSSSTASIFEVNVKIPSPVIVSKFEPIKIDLVRIFLDAAKVLVFGANPVFVDLSGTRGILASVVQAMYPRSEVFYVSENKEDSLSTIAFADAAGMVLNVLSDADDILDAIRNTCKKEAGVINRIVVLGANLYSNERVGKYLILDRLCESDNRITVIVNERSPVSAYQIFEDNKDVDVYISVFWESWRFIWSSSRQLNREPRLDIVVAMYNAEDYIEECILSLCASGRRDVNVLVVDDGSVDNSAKIVDKLAKKFPNIILLRKPNGGCASARNFGRLKSNASHIAFVDADDYVDAGMFDYLFDLALYSSNPVVQAGFTTVGLIAQEGADEVSDAHLAKSHRQMVLADKVVVPLHPHDVLRESPGIWRRVYRRDFLDGRNIWFPEHIKAYDDFIFFILTVQYSPEILHVPDFKYYYRQHPNQDVRKRDARHFYIIEMGHMLLQRAIVEAWKDIPILIEVLRASISWSLNRVDVKYLGRYVHATASLVASIETALGSDVFPCKPEEFIRHLDYRTAYSFEKKCLAEADLGISYVTAFVRTPGMNAEIVEAIAATQDKRLT